VGDVYRKGPVELRLGDYREVLADVEPDAVIADCPYSPRVHSGQRTGTETAKATIEYEPLSPEWCGRFADFWDERSRWWVLTFSDHLGATWWEAAHEARGRYVFAPVIYWRKNATPRVCGDGPTSAVDYITVSRPRRRTPAGMTGSRPGLYGAMQGGWNVTIPGGKDVNAMRSIVRDYSLPGGLVCDPTAGGATTLIAAALEGRRAIGAELDPETYRKACARIERTALTPPLPGLDCGRTDGKQEGLDL